MSKRIMSIIVPADEDYEKFAKRKGVDVFHSHTLDHLKNLLKQARGHLLENHPVQAFFSVELIEKELQRIISEHEE